MRAEVRGWLGALALLAVALAIQWGIRPWVGDKVPFLFLFPALGIAAMWWGWRPAALVLVGGLLHAAYWFPPDDSFAVQGVPDRLALGGFVLAGGVLLALGARLQMLRLRAEQAEARREVAHQEALEAAERLEVALQTSAVPFCLLLPLRNADGRLDGFRWEYLNEAAARLIGQPAPQVVGRPLSELLGAAELEPQLLERCFHALQSGRTVQFETWAEARGARRWFQVSASPFEQGLAVWFADVTARQQQEQALRDADRRKDEFLATLAHELRNPLAPIRQAAMVARAPTATTAQQRWAHDIIERQVAHMALLLDDLLDVSRITRGKLELRRGRVSLQQVVDAAVEAAGPLLQLRSHEITQDLPEATLWIDADALRISQVLSNLLTNAAKYTPPGGHIAIAARAEGEEAVIEVSDDGSGIAPEALDSIFEMFTQVRRPEAGSSTGLGIGLALSRGLVQLHGGSLAAHSAGLGHGATFTVRLPLAHGEEAPAPSAAPAPAATAPATQALRVLVADDNVDAAESLADLLRMEGHDVHVVHDGREAFDAFLRLKPAVALLDIGMPGMTGNEVAAAIRARPDGAAVLLVAITGWGQERDRANAREAGFDHHFTKPVDPARVLQLLG